MTTRFLAPLIVIAFAPLAVPCLGAPMPQTLGKCLAIFDVARTAVEAEIAGQAISADERDQAELYLEHLNADRIATARIITDTSAPKARANANGGYRIGTREVAVYLASQSSTEAAKPAHVRFDDSVHSCRIDLGG